MVDVGKLHHVLIMFQMGNLGGIHIDFPVCPSVTTYQV